MMIGPASSSGRIKIGLVLLSAILCAMGAPPFDVWPAGLLAWLPLIIAFDRVSLKRAVALGWLQGTVSHALVIWAVFPALRHVAGCGPLLAAALTGVFWLFQGARVAVIGFLCGLTRSAGHRRTYIFPLALITAELFFPLLFPWQTTLFVHGAPALLQAADLAGPLLISFIVAAANACIAVAWLERRQGRVRVVVHLSAAVALIAATSLYGWHRMLEVSALTARSPTVRIGVVQGDLAPGSLEQRNPLAIHRDASLDLLRREGPFDLLMWPETVLRSPIQEARIGEYLANTAFREPANSEQPRLRMPLLTGVVLSGSALTNSAVMVTPSGRVLGRQDKHNLVLVGETLPFLDRWPRLRHFFPTSRNFRKGTSFQSMRWRDHRIAVTICYEDTLGGYVSSLVRETQPDLLVNLTSDAWFGRSNVSALHLALSKMRAIEHRRFLVRATNNGISAVVDPAGRVVERLPDGQLAAKVVSASWMSGSTLYEAVGDTPWIVVACSLITGLAVAKVRQLKR